MCMYILYNYVAWLKLVCLVWQWDPMSTRRGVWLSSVYPMKVPACVPLLETRKLLLVSKVRAVDLL